MKKEKQIQNLLKRLERVQKELGKIGIDTPLQYGRGTQRLGHSQKKRDGLAQEKFQIRMKLDELGVEI